MQFYVLKTSYAQVNVWFIWRVYLDCSSVQMSGCWQNVNVPLCDQSISQHLWIEHFTSPESVTRVLYVTAMAKVRSPHRLILDLGVVLMASGQQRPVKIRLRRIHLVTVSASPLSGSSLRHIPNRFKDHKQITCQAMETWITLWHFGTFCTNGMQRCHPVLTAMSKSWQRRCVFLECANNVPMPQTSSGSKANSGPTKVYTEKSSLAPDWADSVALELCYVDGSLASLIRWAKAWTALKTDVIPRLLPGVSAEVLPGSIRQLGAPETLIWYLTALHRLYPAADVRAAVCGAEAAGAQKKKTKIKYSLTAAVINIKFCTHIYFVCPQAHITSMIHDYFPDSAVCRSGASSGCSAPPPASKGTHGVRVVYIYKRKKKKNMAQPEANYWHT